jgi:hypothetical protein
VSYVRLVKSLWIMDHIRDSEDWSRIQRTNPGGLYDRRVREMDRVSAEGVAPEFPQNTDK